MSSSSLLLVGCGKMGGALLARWQEKQPCGLTRFAVIEPAQARPHDSRAEWFFNPAALPSGFTPDIVVFAVKPQHVEPLLAPYSRRFGAKPLYISIVAGKNLKFFSQGLGEHAHVVRAMPNTPALLGKAMTALAAAETLPESAKRMTTELFNAVGKTVWVNEADMHAVTALSGSGPAYAFLLLEALTAAGIRAGLPETTAKLLALQTLHGAVHLAEKSLESFKELRGNVTSPGGTTEAALAVLMQPDGLEKLMGDAIEAAIKKSKEL